MKTNFKKIRRLCPLQRNVLTRHVDRLMRDFTSLNDDRRRAYIIEVRDAANSLCASAFQTAVTARPARKKVTAVWQDKNGQQYKITATSSDAAEEDSETQIPEVFDDGDSALDAARSKLDGGAPGVDPEIALRDLVAEVRDIEVSLQDLAPSVALAERVESRLRELFTTDLRQPSGKGGRPVQKPLDVEAIRRALGQTSKSVFARLCGISVKTLDRALAGNTVSKATCDGIDKYLKTLRKNTPQKRQ